MPVRIGVAGGLAVWGALTAPVFAQMQGFGEPSYKLGGPAATGLSPEDIVTLPGTKWLIAGALPKTDAGARGGLSVIDTEDPATILPLYPAAGASDSPNLKRFRDCPGPLAGGFAPHGINVETAPDGSIDVMAVNHHGRESIEFFHISLGSDAPPRCLDRVCRAAHGRQRQQRDPASRRRHDRHGLYP